MSHFASVLTSAMIALAVAGGASAQRVDYARDVLPILSDNCYHCHGPDEQARKARLRLDTKEGAFRTRNDRTVIIPGKTGESELIKRITSDDETEVMPPPESNRTLSAKQIELLRQWVEQGAKWGGHWAFIAPQRTPATGTRNAIDYFIGERLKKEGLEPSPEATR